MKSTLKLVGSFIAASLFAAGLLYAADQSKPGKCCASASKDGKSCTHACCVESAKKGDNCTKCGGAGKISTDKK